MAEDRIIFLGTGGGRVVVANQMVATGGFVIQLAGWQIHVDPGPGATARAKQFGVRPSRTDIVFVSHHHIDHVNDLNAVIDAVTLGGIFQKGIVISTQTVISGAENESPWLQPFYKKQLKGCFALKPGDVVKLGNLNFIATPTKHDIEDAIGLRLETPGLTIGYTSDTVNFPELIEAFKGCNVLILNMLRPGKERYKSHLCAEDVEDIISKVKPELAIITGFGGKVLKANPIYEAREIQRKTEIRTIAAADGVRIELTSLKQRPKV